MVFVKLISAVSEITLNLSAVRKCDPTAKTALSARNELDVIRIG